VKQQHSKQRTTRKPKPNHNIRSTANTATVTPPFVLCLAWLQKKLRFRCLDQADWQFGARGKPSTFAYRAG